MWRHIGKQLAQIGGTQEIVNTEGKTKKSIKNTVI